MVKRYTLRLLVRSKDGGGEGDRWRSGGSKKGDKTSANVTSLLAALKVVARRILRAEWHRLLRDVTK